MPKEIYPTILAIISISAMEIVALLKGIDGALLLPVVGIVSGLGGYSVKGLLDKYKK